MKRKINNLTDTIQELLAQYNAKRSLKGLKPVTREWTGVCHWLNEPLPDGTYRALGNLIATDERLVGFLEGLLYDG